jgi:hypothetical protein
MGERDSRNHSMAGRKQLILAEFGLVSDTHLPERCAALPAALFEEFAAARRAIAAWIAWCDAERPQQALGYRSPDAFRSTAPQAA